MSLTLAARVSLVSCAVWLSLQANSSSARLTPYSGDPPALLAFAASDADHAWLSRANPECQLAFRHAGENVLAAENAFLRHLRNQEAAVLDAGNPADADHPAEVAEANSNTDDATENLTDSDYGSAPSDEDVASDDSGIANPENAWAEEGAAESDDTWNDEAAANDAENDDDDSETTAASEALDDQPFPLIVLKDEPAAEQELQAIGLWRALNNLVWGSCDREEPGLLEQAVQAVEALAAGYDASDMNLLALADLPIPPAGTDDADDSDEANESDESPNTDESDEDNTEEANDTDEEFVPAPDNNDAFVPAAPENANLDESFWSDEREDFVPAEEDGANEALPRDQCRRDGVSADDRDLSALRIATLPSVTNEATIRSIISSATLGGLIDRNALSAEVRETFANPAEAPAIELADIGVLPEPVVEPVFDGEENATDEGVATDANGEAYDWQRYYAEEAYTPNATPNADETEASNTDETEANSDDLPTDDETTDDDGEPKFQLEWELAD